MTHVITTYGGGEAFYYVFQSIAALLGSGGFLNNILRLSGILGVTWVFVLAAFRNALEQGIQWLFWFMAATNLLFLPKATVWIKDPLTFQAPRKVDNVPLVLAVFAGSVSSIGAALTEKMESVFTLPDYLPYHQTGTVFASRLMMEARHIRLTDPDFRANMERFVNRCVVFDALMGHKYTLKELRTAQDIWGLVSSQASPVLGFLYRPPGRGTEGEIVTCKRGAALLQNLWESQLREAARQYGAHFFHRNAASGRDLFLQYLPQSYQLLTKMAGDAPKLLQQEMMINAIIDGSHHKLDEMRGGLTYTTARSLMQQDAAHRTMGETALRLLPVLKAVIEALCYAAFLFVMILSLMPQGWRVLLNYAGLLMWLQMWAPLYAVLNLFMTLYGQSRSTALLGGQGLTMINAVGLSSLNAQIASLAGWLSCSLPFIAHAIMKGGVSAFMNMAGSLTSSLQGTVSSASSEASSGNISLGNVSMGTTAYQNTTAFQSNTAPSYRDGSFEQVIDDGTILMTQGDGSQIFRGGAGFNTSTLRIRAHASENFAERAEEQISHQNAVLQAQSEEYAATRMEAGRQVLSLAHSSAKGQNSSQGYEHSAAFGDHTAVSQALRFNKTLQDQEGFNESQATELTAAIMGGARTPKILEKLLSFNVEGRAAASTKAERSKQASDIQNLANEMGITNSLDETVRTLKDNRFSDSQSQEARLAQDIGHTMEKAENIRSAMSKTQQAIDSYSKVQAFSKTGGFNIDRDESQELLEFAANRIIQGRRIGMEGAYRLLDTGGYQADGIVSDFREAKWQGIKSRIDAGLAIKSEEDLNALYRNASLPGNRIRSNVDHSLGTLSGDSIQQQASSQGLHDPVRSTAKTDYEQQKKYVSHEISRTGGYLSEQEKTMDKKTGQTFERSLAGATAFNAGEGIASTVSGIFSSVINAPETLSRLKETITDRETYTSNFKRPDDKILTDQESLQKTAPVSSSRKLDTQNLRASKGIPNDAPQRWENNPVSGTASGLQPSPPERKETNPPIKQTDFERTKK